MNVPPESPASLYGLEALAPRYGISTDEMRKILSQYKVDLARGSTCLYKVGDVDAAMQLYYEEHPDERRPGAGHAPPAEGPSDSPANPGRRYSLAEVCQKLGTNKSSTLYVLNHREIFPIERGRGNQPSYYDAAAVDTFLRTYRPGRGKRNVAEPSSDVARPEDERGYSGEEVAAILGISRNRSSEILKENEIEFTRDGSRRYFDADGVRAMVVGMRGAAGIKKSSRADAPEGQHYTTRELAEKLGGVHASHVPYIMRKFGIEPQRAGRSNVYPTELSDAAVKEYLAGRGSRTPGRGDKTEGAEGKPKDAKATGGVEGYTRDQLAEKFGVHPNNVRGIAARFGVKPRKVGRFAVYPTEMSDVAVEKYRAMGKSEKPSETKAPRRAATKGRAKNGQIKRERQQKAEVQEEQQPPAYEFAGISYDPESNRFIIGVAISASDALEPLEMRLKTAHPDAYRDAILEGVNKTPDVALSYLAEVFGGKKKGR